jgi:hypothetical protein
MQRLRGSSRELADVKPRFSQSGPTPYKVAMAEDIRRANSVDCSPCRGVSGNFITSGSAPHSILEADEHGLW